MNPIVSEPQPATTFDPSRCRSDFPALARTGDDGRPLAFLDGPAGTQVPRAVVEAIAGYYATSNANTLGEFPTSRDSDRLIQATREAVAAFVGAESWRSISFGANMTTLAFAVARAVGREIRPGDEVVVTQLDHEANRAPWTGLAERGATVREVALRPDGRLDGDDLAAKIGPRTRLVAIGLASNALGTVNLDEVRRARELTRAAGALLAVDAVHYAPHFPLDAAALDPDFLLCSAYKFYGPHVGILYTRPGLLERLPVDRLRTQSDEPPFRIETGTLNHAALAGVKAAVDYLASWREGPTLRARLAAAMAAIGVHERALARRYHDAVRALPGVTVQGPGFDDGPRAPTVAITLDGAAGPIDPAVAARFLGDRGVQVWDGHFYALRAIEALGLAERGGVVRVGTVMYSTGGEIDRLLAGIEELLDPTHSSRWQR